MRYSKLLLIGLLVLLIVGGCKVPSVTNSLPRSTPEAEGVSSQGIIDFLDAASKSKHEFHSFVFLRHGRVIAEGWWNPYRQELKHTLYSTSKSVTATAVGFAVSEKRLTVNDKVISFFPDDLPDTISPYLSKMTVKDLLTMTVGQYPEPTFRIVSSESNWVKGFLSFPIVNDPGTKFLYNSLASYMLSAIVQKVTGEKVIDYLKPRLFEPLGIKDLDWETDPYGINTGGWGLRLKTEDLAKFGQLFLNKGIWNGKQLLPKAWIEEASTSKIEQVPNAPQAIKDSSDWMQGYCYQMWRCRHNAFRGDGAFGQFIIVMPEKDAVIAITAETPDMQDEINLVWHYLLPAMHKNKLSGDNKANDILKQKLSSLSILPPEKGIDSPLASEISEKTFNFDLNDKHIESMSFHFMNNNCYVTLKTDTAEFNLAFGSGIWQLGETTKHGPNLVSLAKASFTGLPPVMVAGNFRWQNENTLELTLRYIESPHTETILCRFDQKKVEVDFQNSFSPGNKTPVLKGEIRL